MKLCINCVDAEGASQSVVWCWKSDRWCSYLVWILPVLLMKFPLPVQGERSFTLLVWRNANCSVVLALSGFTFLGRGIVSIFGGHCLVSQILWQMCMSALIIPCPPCFRSFPGMLSMPCDLLVFKTFDCILYFGLKYWWIITSSIDCCGIG